jgi:hypothetical protein
MGSINPDYIDFLKSEGVRESLEALKSHCNYRDQEPLVGESLIAYTLRCAAHLVSPPQDDDESYDVECITVQAVF